MKSRPIAIAALQCGHCKAFAPVWDEVATKLKPATGVNFAKIDATAETTSAAKCVPFLHLEARWLLHLGAFRDLCSS